jgi:hypothetical protein
MRADRHETDEPAVYWIKLKGGKVRHATLSIVEFPNPIWVKAVPLCAMTRTVFMQCKPGDESPICKGCNDTIINGNPETYFPPPEPPPGFSHDGRICFSGHTHESETQAVLCELAGPS